MKRKLSTASDWQRARAQTLQAICEWIEAHEAEYGKMGAVTQAAKRNKGKILNQDSSSLKHLKLSTATLYRELKRWRHLGRKPEAFLQNYTGAKRRIPGELLIEWRRRCLMPGMKYDTVAYRKLCEDFAGGASIPGLGTWVEHWRNEHGNASLPEMAPEFPYGYTTLSRYSPSRPARALGNRGVAAMRRELTPVDRDYSLLRPCELFMFDDKLLDLLVLDDIGGTLERIRPTIYVAMEVSCRLIPAFVTRGAESILQADVDALVARTLKQCGIAVDYQTTLLFERGTVACSRAREDYLKLLFGERISIRRTSMDGGRGYSGAFMDSASGHAAGKACIEAFMRKLDFMLMHLPAQTGNKYDAQPAELDARAREAELHAVLERVYGVGILEKSILTLTQLNAILREIINAHNHNSNHSYQGFGEIIEAEIAPGQWKPI